MVLPERFSFPSHNGIDAVAVQKWSSSCQPKAVLQIAHGVNEHAGRYQDFADFLSQKGFVVVANDHLGHGRTVGQEALRGHLEPGGWEDLVADIHQLYQLTKKQYPALPYFLLGHSMGSFLVRTYLILYPGSLEGVLLSGTGQMPAPLIQAGYWVACRMKRHLGATGRSKALDKLCFGAYNKRFAPNRTASDWLSRDEAVVDSFIQDPMCGGIPTASLFCEMLRGLAYIGNPAHLAKMDLQTPVLFFSGDQDPVGECGKGVERVYRKFLAAGCRNVTLHLYPQGRHEMLNEVNRNQVYQDVLVWLEQSMTMYSQSNKLEKTMS